MFARSLKGKAIANASKAVIADLEAANGTVRAIGRVLIPWKEVFRSIRANR